MIWVLPVCWDYASATLDNPFIFRPTRIVNSKWWGISITHADGRRESHDLWDTHGRHHVMK